MSSEQPYVKDSTIVFELVCGTETGIHLHGLNMPRNPMISLTRLVGMRTNPAYSDFITHYDNLLSFKGINGSWVYELHEINDLFFKAYLVEGNPTP